MSENLTPRQQILLWDLISRGGSALQGDLKGEVGPEVRGPLVRGGLISVTKRKNANVLTIEDRAWNYISSVAPTLLKSGEGSKHDRAILQFVLARLQSYATTADPPLPYASIFALRGDGAAIRLTSPDSVAPPEPLPLSIEAAIRSAFFEIAGRPAHDGVRLRALRERLPLIARADLDAALLEMRKSGAANLMNLDNPRDIEAEGGAPLKVGGQTFHLLWIDS